MNVKELVIAVPAMFRSGVVPYILGNQGIGKTQIAKNLIAIPNGYRPYYLNFGNLELGDFLGVMVRGSGKDENKSVHLKPNWWPEEHEKVLIICDEINRCKSEELQSAMLTFINEGRIHNHILPENCKIMLIGNYEDDSRFSVTPLSDLALSQRVCHIDFRPTNEELQEYARSLGRTGAITVADYLLEHPQNSGLASKGKVDLNKKVPDPRSWFDFVSKLEEEDLPEKVRQEIYSGLIGPNCAVSFLFWKKNQSKRIKGWDVLDNYAQHRNSILDMSKDNKIEVHKINAIIEDILDILSKNVVLKANELDNFKSFMVDLPAEISVSVLKKLQDLTQWNQRFAVLNDINFIKKFEFVNLGQNILKNFDQIQKLSLKKVGN